MQSNNRATLLLKLLFIYSMLGGYGGAIGFFLLIAFQTQAAFGQFENLRAFDEANQLTVCGGNLQNGPVIAFDHFP